MREDPRRHEAGVISVVDVGPGSQVFALKPGFFYRLPKHGGVTVTGRGKAEELQRASEAEKKGLAYATVPGLQHKIVITKGAYGHVTVSEGARVWHPEPQDSGGRWEALPQLTDFDVRNNAVLVQLHTALEMPGGSQQTGHEVLAVSRDVENGVASGPIMMQLV